MSSHLPDPVPIHGVIFDFHATLVDTQDPGGWIEAAGRLLGRPPSGPTAPGTAEFADLRDHLHRLWEHAAPLDPKSERDLSHEQHRDVFRQTLELRPEADQDLIEALYTVLVDQWVVFEDTVPVLRELRARGVRIVVLSNVGLDIRNGLEAAGITDLIDGVVLSYEVGVVKPDPEIFQLALGILQLPAAEVLMVGDSWRDDAGAAALGIRTLILPRTVGSVHGLSSVLRLVG